MLSGLFSFGGITWLIVQLRAQLRFLEFWSQPTNQLKSLAAVCFQSITTLSCIETGSERHDEDNVAVEETRLRRDRVRTSVLQPQLPQKIRSQRGTSIGRRQKRPASPWSVQKRWHRALWNGFDGCRNNLHEHHLACFHASKRRSWAWLRIVRLSSRNTKLKRHLSENCMP